MRIKLVRSSDDFCLLANKPNGSYKVKIKDLYIEMRKIHLAPSLITQHQSLFDKGNMAYYPIRQSKITTFLLIILLYK